jgi:hypothetical protein
MKFPPVQLTKRKPLFWSIFSVPLASTITSCLLDPWHWYYYVAALGCAYFALLAIMRSLTSGCIEDRWGRLEKKDHPMRFWIQVCVWVAMLLCATAFPLAIILSLKRS